MIYDYNFNFLLCFIDFIRILIVQFKIFEFLYFKILTNQSLLNYLLNKPNFNDLIIIFFKIIIEAYFL
jgi:hypothetical protein